MLNYLYIKEVIKLQMYLQSMCCYWRSTYRQYIKIHNVLRSYSYLPSDMEHNASQISKSKKFPEHQLVYTFPYIKQIQILNSLKRNATIYTGASIPLCTVLQAIGLIGGADTISLILVNLVITFWFHATFYPSNNFIGSMYYKEDNQEVIISYLNYWGKRTDLKTNIDDIMPLTETPLNILNFIYRNLNVISHKRKLKISIKHGRIMNKKYFEHLVGDIS